MPKKLRPGRRINPEILLKDEGRSRQPEAAPKKVARAALSTGRVVNLDNDLKITGPMSEVQTPHEFLANCYAADPDVRRLASTVTNRCLYKSEADQLLEIVDRTGSNPTIIFDALMIARDQFERLSPRDQA